MAQSAPRRTVVSVFLPREHLPFLRAWCEHHIAQGWDIFLYDNTGAEGSLRATTKFLDGRPQRAGIDARGNRYGAFSEQLSERDLSNAMLESVADLPVTVKSWKPRDEKGAISFGQVEAYVDFIHNHSEGVEWAAFIDVDEYLWTAEGLTWDMPLGRMAEAKCHRLLLEAQSYEGRWTEDGKPNDIEALRCCGLQYAGNHPGGMKNIVRPDKAIRADIHWNWEMQDGDLCARVDVNQFCFRHYNRKRFDFSMTILSQNPHTRPDESIAV